MRKVSQGLQTGEDYFARHEWSKDTQIQCGDKGIVFNRKSKDNYTTAFFEAFPRFEYNREQIGTFIRGEGKTIADAEDSAWNKYQTILNCKTHDFRDFAGVKIRKYSNGCAFCMECNAQHSEYFEPIHNIFLTDGAMALFRDYYTDGFVNSSDHAAFIEYVLNTHEKSLKFAESYKKMGMGVASLDLHYYDFFEDLKTGFIIKKNKLDLFERSIIPMIRYQIENREIKVRDNTIIGGDMNIKLNFVKNAPIALGLDWLDYITIYLTGQSDIENHFSFFDIMSDKTNFIKHLGM